MSGTRCWGDGDPLFERYDEEWGFPVLDERGLIERLALETFESGLSWRTILAKRRASLGPEQRRGHQLRQDVSVPQER